MCKFSPKSIITVLVVALVLGLIGPITTLAAGPAPVNLLSAGNFVVLSQTGITNTGSHASVITGNIGTSPITAAAMNNIFCSEITGTIYGVNAAYVGSGNQTCFAGNPPLANKTLVDNAVLDMGTAYADAAGRTLPDATELYSGNLGGRTIAPGLYKWSTDVTIPTSVTLSGGPNDTWIFQITGDLNIASAKNVILAGGAKASNIFWQVGGPTGATLGTNSTFNGNILSSKQVIIQTGAVLNGRAFAQTQVTLDSNVATLPTASTTSSLAGAINGNVTGGASTSDAALVVTSIDRIQTIATADNTFEHGWKYIFHITAPTSEPKLAMKFTNWTGPNSSILPVANNMRISSNQANSTSTMLITAAGTYSIPDLNMVTDLDSSLPGRQIQVTVEVKIPTATTNGSYTTTYGVRSLAI
ncbi:MAG: ice-binding family protein [bacterium]